MKCKKNIFCVTNFYQSKLGYISSNSNVAIFFFFSTKLLISEFEREASRIQGDWGDLRGSALVCVTRSQSHRKPGLGQAQTYTNHGNTTAFQTGTITVVAAALKIGNTGKYGLGSDQVQQEQDLDIVLIQESYHNFRKIFNYEHYAHLTCAHLDTILSSGIKQMKKSLYGQQLCNKLAPSNYSSLNFNNIKVQLSFYHIFFSLLRFNHSE